MSKSNPPASNPTTSRSKQSDATTDPDKPGNSSDDVASMLKEYCIASAKAFNDRDIELRENGLYKLVTPDFRARFWNSPEGLALPEHGKRMRKVIEEFPDYQVEVISVSPKVFEEEGTAVVYAEYFVTGAPPGVEARLINEFKWRKEEDGWRCFYMQTMKGVNETN
jgi:hypothetical protein